MSVLKPMRIRVSINGLVTEWMLKSGHSLRFGTESGWADVLLQSAASSGRDFVLRLLDRQLVLEDMGSSSGVWMAGKKVRRANLDSEATVQAADVEIRIEILPERRAVERTAVLAPTVRDTALPVEKSTERAAAVEEHDPESPFLSRMEKFEEFQAKISSAPGLFAILDLARGKEVIKRVLTCKERCECLYEGESAQRLRLRAPHLVELPPGSAFLSALVMKGWGKSWGIYFSTPASFEEVRRHFRHFLFVTLEDGAEVYFRFYDPRVLRAFLPTCKPAEIREFFGPIRSFWAEAESADAAHVFSFRPLAAPSRRS